MIITDNIRVIKSDVTNNNAVANTLQDVTGLEFAVKSGSTYRFYAMIPYTSAITTTGSRWVIATTNVPTFIATRASYTLTATTETIRFESAINSPATSNGTSLTAANIAVIEGILKPSADDTVKVRFASEIANSAIVAKAGGFIQFGLVN